MIHSKYKKIVFPVIMAFFMSCIMSFVITLFNLGFVDELITIWLRSWLFAFIVALPTIIVISPIVHKITERLTHH